MYSTCMKFEREIYSIHWGLRKFKSYLTGIYSNFLKSNSKCSYSVETRDENNLLKKEFIFFVILKKLMNWLNRLWFSLTNFLTFLRLENSNPKVLCFVKIASILLQSDYKNLIEVLPWTRAFLWSLNWEKLAASYK